MCDWMITCDVILGLITALHLMQGTEGACESHVGVDRLSADKYGTINFFYSPGTTRFPNYTYYDDQYCEWQIRSEDSDRLVKIHITLYNVEDDPDCSLDSITIYDGRDKDASEIATICGVNKNPVYYSSSTYMFVVFKTNHQNHYQGFAAKYSSYSRPREVGGGAGTMGATMGSIAAGALVIGAICCCCFKKGMKGRAIKPSTTFRFGNRGLFSGSITTTMTTTNNRCRNNARTITVFNVRNNAVQFNNSPLQPAPPPSYSSLALTSTAPLSTQQRQMQAEAPPPAYSSIAGASSGVLSPSSLTMSEPPRYSSIAGNVAPTVSETEFVVPPQQGRTPGRPMAADPAGNVDTLWSPPPPYEYKY